jgi:hypothetical protein
VACNTWICGEMMQIRETYAVEEKARELTPLSRAV